MTIEELVGSTQREFQTLRGEMATKEDVRTILHAIEGIDAHVSSYASRWSEDFAKLHDWVRELDSRVKFLEKTKS